MPAGLTLSLVDRVLAPLLCSFSLAGVFCSKLVLGLLQIPGLLNDITSPSDLKGSSGSYAAMFCPQSHTLSYPFCLSQCIPPVASKNHKSRVQVSLFLKPVFPSGPPSKFLLLIGGYCTWRMDDERSSPAHFSIPFFHLGPLIGTPLSHSLGELLPYAIAILSYQKYFQIH